MEYQFAEIFVPSNHDPPKFVDAKILPGDWAANNLLPSAEDAIKLAGGERTGVSHVEPEFVER